MEIIIVMLITIIVSSLTFLSGFGLGTLLLPAFILFFPIDTAVAATAIVHLANNVFKAFLAGKKADLSVVLRFSIPGALFAILGSLLLEQITSVPAIVQYQFVEKTFYITPIKLLIAAVMALFCILEFLPSTKKLSLPVKYIPLGGAISGFFGGLSGHQGALRAAFLVRLGLNKETFVGTTILSSIVIDIARLVVYGKAFFIKDFQSLVNDGRVNIIIAGIISALLGAVLGYFFLKKVSLDFIHNLVGILLLFYSIALAMGLI